MTIHTSRSTLSAALVASIILAPALLWNLMSTTYAAITPPTCNGLTATVYVDGGFIVGGDDAGDPFTGDLTGTSGDDVIVGTSGDDEIDGDDGDDTICGLDGDDEIDGGDGNDTIFGGAGEDEISGGDDNDEISGGPDDDDIEGDSGEDKICGDDGNDVIDGGGGNDILCGGEGDDELDGGSGGDTIDGGNGTDEIDGGSGTDTCREGETTTGCEATALVVSYCFSKGGTTSSSPSSSSSSSSSSTSSSTSSSSSSTSSSTSSSSSSASSTSFSTSSAGGGGTPVNGGGGGHYTDGNTVGQGSHLGAGTLQIYNAAISLLENFFANSGLQTYAAALDTVSPGGFGGGQSTQGSFGPQFFTARPTFYLSSTPPVTSGLAPTAIGGISDNQKEVICKGQTILSRHDDFAESRNLLSLILSQGLNMSHAVAYALLGNEEFCEGVIPVRTSFYWKIQGQNRPEQPQLAVNFTVDEEGIPVSSNPVWNACIRGEIVKDQYGKRVNCNRDNFHANSTWYHPDFPHLPFKFVLNDRRGHTYPENFNLIVLKERTEARLLSAARIKNRLQVARAKTESTTAVLSSEEETVEVSAADVSTQTDSEPSVTILSE